MRVHKPIPILLMLLPILIVIFAQFFLDIQNQKLIDSDYVLMVGKLIGITILGSFIARSLGCIINDFFDRDIDSNTVRVASRPLVDASNNDKPSKIGIVVISLLLFFISILLSLELGKTPFIISLIAGLFISMYPLTKRFFILPQLFLGITYNLGIIIICSSVKGWINVPLILFFLINVIWTFTYDTVYAMQDIEDDKRNEVHSSAILMEKDFINITKKLYNVILFSLWVFCFVLGGKILYIAIFFMFLLSRKYIAKLELDNGYQRFFEDNWKLFAILLFGILSDVLLECMF